MCLWFWGLLCSLHINLWRHNTPQYHLHQAQYQHTIPTIPYIKIFTKNGRLRGNFLMTRNLEYPSTYNAESSCTWTVPKIQSDVCHIRWDICHLAFYLDTLTMVRLDFDAFTLANPSIEGRCSGTDYIQVSVFASVFYLYLCLYLCWTDCIFKYYNISDKQTRIFNWLQF